ncbi:ATP-binding cassette domain-containing protein [Caloramator sp. mosi_1]|uniref:ATP-binding cassette domain-containing protein n=1 Tax=Caloramator sp. mosi_1 TaxID=3023090 RepID=UPI0023626EE4|nr:ATP-binding cassette domain-containing protein [Caloramator sp. mosi_1]WDC85409.1 ATP-binding cassette domain-containing protein [Caloramator sp. mosi_1]
MILKVDGLEKSFRGQKVLNDVSFELKEGEIVSIFGKSGAGKSTLLRCINGIENIDRGA